jgi:hypothetical protein
LERESFVVPPRTPAETVVMWFDAGFYAPPGAARWVIGAFIADAWGPPRPYVAPFPPGGLTYANEIGIAITGYPFDSGPVFPGGAPDAGQLGELEAELFDLYAAWSGLNYAFQNGHRGHVIALGDGTSAVDFLRREKSLDLSDHGVDTEGMRRLIEDVAGRFSGVEWHWVQKGTNPSVEIAQARMKDLLRSRVPGEANHPLPVSVRRGRPSCPETPAPLDE